MIQIPPDSLLEEDTDPPPATWRFELEGRGAADCHLPLKSGICYPLLLVAVGGESDAATHQPRCLRSLPQHEVARTPAIQAVSPVPGAGCRRSG